MKLTDVAVRCGPTADAAESRDGRDAVVSPAEDCHDECQVGTRSNRSTGQACAVSWTCAGKGPQNTWGISDPASASVQYNHPTA